MAAIYEITLEDGEKETVRGEKFTHKFGPYEAEFGVHYKPGDGFDRVVTHLKSGRRVSDMSRWPEVVNISNDVAAARRHIDLMADLVGPERMRSVIAAASPAGEI